MKKSELKQLIRECICESADNLIINNFISKIRKTQDINGHNISTVEYYPANTEKWTNDIGFGAFLLLTTESSTNINGPSDYYSALIIPMDKNFKTFKLKLHFERQKNVDKSWDNLNINQLIKILKFYN